MCIRDRFIPGHRYGGTASRLEKAGYLTRVQEEFYRPVYYPTDKARALLQDDETVKAAFADYLEAKERREKIYTAIKTGKERRTIE